MDKIYQKTFSGSKTAGFTLIELLVVVLIIGVLAAVALPQYQKAVAKTRAVSVLPLLRAINDAEQRYFMANNDYTLSFADLDIAMPAGGTLSTGEIVQTLNYRGFSCFLRRSAGSARQAESAYCNSNNAEGVRVEKYFYGPCFICWAAPDTRAYSICQSISGKTAPDGYSSGGTASFYF